MGKRVTPTLTRFLNLSFTHDKFLLKNLPSSSEAWPREDGLPLYRLGILVVNPLDVSNHVLEKKVQLVNYEDEE